MDFGGKTSITLLLANPTASSIIAAIAAISNSAETEHWEGPLVIASSPSPTFATYPSIAQQAVLSFRCADNTIARVAVPAPALSIFLADGITVDASTITTLITACISQLVSNTGSAAVSFIGGSLQGLK